MGFDAITFSPRLSATRRWSAARAESRRARLIERAIAAGMLLAIGAIAWPQLGDGPGAARAAEAPAPPAPSRQALPSAENFMGSHVPASESRR